MSSTNVHSESNDYENKILVSVELEIVGGEVRVKSEKNYELDMPPQNAIRVSQEKNETFEIPVAESTLNKDGSLVGKNGNVVAHFEKDAVKTIIKNKNDRKSLKQQKNKSKVDDVEIGG